MEIQIITQKIENSFDNSKEFGLILMKTLTLLKMIHWYIDDYNSHRIFGKLYDKLNDLTDSLQEEIIGISKINENTLFPKFNINGFLSVTDSDIFCSTNLFEIYNSVYLELSGILTSSEFKSFISENRSGVNNTVEEILSTFNNANYLLSLVNKA
jgi:hypothetical protein